MNFLIVLITIGVACSYANSQIQKLNEPLLLYYATWVTILISLNVLVSVFIYLFTHSLKENPGNTGIRGKTGIRGEEGKSQYCDFPRVK